MRKLSGLACALTLVGAAMSNEAKAQPASCPGGVINVVEFGADGTVAADNAAFAQAYAAAIQSGGPCEGDRIYVPAGNWAGHWPTIASSVYIQGAGASATNFTGDGSALPILWATAPVTFDSFGFWGSPNLNLRLDGGSDTSVLNNIDCRTSTGSFIYNANNQDVHFENISAFNCGNTTSTPLWMGGTLVLNNSNNIYIDSPNFMGEPNSAIVAVDTPSVIIYGGEINNAFAYSMTSPLILAVGSSVYNASGIWASLFYIGGTNAYDLEISSPDAAFSGYQITFGGAGRGVTTPGSSAITCNQCTIQ